MKAKFQIITYDVWGHSHADCGRVDSGCKCVRLEGDEYVDTGAECQCSYDVNDQFRAGEVEFEFAGDMPTTEELEKELTGPGGMLTFYEGVLTIESDGERYEVEMASDGKPVMGLERVET